MFTTTSKVASPTAEAFDEVPNRPEGADVAQGSEECEETKAKRAMSLNTTYDGPIIPPSTKARRKNRTVVLCFDGTGDQFDDDNSNVVCFFSLLKKGDIKQQLVYYQAGIGTYTVPQIATPMASKFRKTFDMMLGSSLNQHVMSGYEFLMQHYREGDRICIFGFSRGAYTARALAGMIEKVGLLPAGNHQQVPFAYKMYMQDDNKGWEMSADFKRTFSMNVPIEFVGVWDTVDSVGLFPRHVPFTKNNTCVKTFRHAISLDEHRVKFKPNLFEKVVSPDVHVCDLTYTPLGTRAQQLKEKLSHIAFRSRHKHVEIRGSNDAYNRASKLQDEYTDTTRKTDVLEVWFAGCHTDVGGGSVPNKTYHSLARIPLRWMIRQCFEAETGIQFERDRLYDVGLSPDTLYPKVLPRPEPLPLSTLTLPHHPEHPDNDKRIRKPAEIRVICDSCPADQRKARESSGESSGETEDTIVDHGWKRDRELGAFAREMHEELHDALQPSFDQLKLARSWWILEVMPLVHRVQKRNGESVKVISINAGRARRLAMQRENGIKVHRSVKLRMEAESLEKKYLPKLKFHVEPTWID